MDADAKLTDAEIGELDESIDAHEGSYEHELRLIADAATAKALDWTREAWCIPCPVWSHDDMPDCSLCHGTGYLDAWDVARALRQKSDYRAQIEAALAEREKHHEKV